MSNLNEDCLRHIFSYLQPHDWIHTSKVCELWKIATLCHWMKITKISRLTNSEYDENARIISIEEAEKIIHYAAPFIKILDLSEYTFERFSTFGHFLYRVEHFEDDKIVKLLLTHGANEITEVRFYNLPKTDLSEMLFYRNKITKLEFCDSGDIYPNLPTHGIEELKAEFTGVDRISSFQGLFPNLKKLELKLQCLKIVEGVLKDKPKKIFPKIIPYIQGVKSFHLKMTAETVSPHLYLHLLQDISKFSQLEELSIDLFDMHVLRLASFVNDVANGSQKLQAMTFRGIKVTNLDLERIRLMVGKLKNMDMDFDPNFDWTELSSNEKALSELRMTFYHHRN